MNNIPNIYSDCACGNYQIDLRCPKCKHEWNAYGYEELGGWTFDDERMAYCPECDTEGVER